MLSTESWVVERGFWIHKLMACNPGTHDTQKQNIRVAETKTVVRRYVL